MQRVNKYLIGILVIASAFRIVALNNHMPALYGDEISIAYNAYSVLTTGKDEFGKWLPIQFESWGDQKNPVYIYVVAIFQIVFGLSEWSVRLPSACAGVIAVFYVYKMVEILCALSKKFSSDESNRIGLIAALLLSLSPWHVHVSRGGYEANLALTFGLVGTYYALKFFNTKTTKSLAISISMFVLAMYTYYTTKMFIPMFIVVLIIYGKQYFSDTKQYIRLIAKAAVVFVVCCIPIIYLAFFSQGQARFQTINIFSQPSIEGRVVTARTMYAQYPLLAKLAENKFTYYTRDFLEYYFDNFSGQFWYVAGDSSLRYGMGNHGMFYLVELPFLLIGIIALYKKDKRMWGFLIAWIVLAPLPTALVGKAYGLRSLAMLPIPMIFSAIGVVYILNAINSKKIRLAVSAFSICAYVVAVSNWGIRYAYLYPVYGQYWYDSMQKEAIMYAKSQEANFDHIIISRWYGKTEMYYAFYDKIRPSEYQRNSQNKVKIADTEMIQFGKYYFGDIDANGKEFDQLNIPGKTLILGSPKFAFSDEYVSAKDDGRLLFKTVKYK
jgi:4-amino-4-deoxy-L-arabinose transferase-like glycosyltransferase